MSHPDRKKASDHARVLLWAAFAVAAPLSALDAASALHRAEAPFVGQGQPLDSDADSPFTRSAPADRRHWLKFDTDACGTLQGIQSSRSLLSRSALDEDVDGDDEEMDPSAEAQDLIGSWLAAHAEIAVVNDGVDKSCGVEGFGDEDLPEVDA